MTAPRGVAGPVLVLGATGFIGRRVMAALARRGARVLASGRDARALDALRDRTSGSVEAVTCDVARADDVIRLLHTVRPAAIFNLAGYGVDRTERDEGLAWRINAELPAQLTELMRELPRPDGTAALVHAGSALEYGVVDGALNEDGPVRPTTLYGRTKLAGTQAVVEAGAAGLPALTARLFTVYGPGEHAGRLLPSLLEAARAGNELPMTAGLQLRDFTFVDDVVEGLLRLASSPARPGAVVNLATGRLESVRGFAERAARVLGMDASLLRFGAVPTRGEEMEHEPVSVERLRALTGGWAPATTIEEGVRITLDEWTANV